MPSSQSSRDALLERLAEEFVERHRRGERPPLSEYINRHPDLAAEVRELFPALVQIEKLKPVAGDLTGEFVPTSDAQAEYIPERFGEYRILRQIGQGGMGIVYEAEQESLGRHVALKVLPRQALLKTTYLERFRREAKAAGRLHHTNIVPVFGVGECNGTHYFAMQFIPGEGLDKVLGDLRRLRAAVDPGGAATAVKPAEWSVAQSLLTGSFIATPAPSPESPPASSAPSSPTSADKAHGSSTLSVGGSESRYYRGIARLALQVADALAYAHRQGILHRDIKPSNLLLDQQGIVWITDFGLAKAEGADDLTQTGDIVGTVRYMAPERFDGRSLPQSDVYALGVTLYELLTLRPAFEDANKARLVERVLHEPPVLPRKIDPRIPRDLETVVLKCLAKEPAERYASAEAVAEDVRRFLADRPILARRSTWRERTWRWCRRNPVVASLIAALLFVLTVTAIGGIVMSLLLGESLQEAREAQREGKRKLFASYVSEADAIRMSRRPGQRFGALRSIRKALEVGSEIGLSDEDKVRLRNIAVAALCLPDMEPGLEWPAGSDESLPENLDSVFQRHLRSRFARDRLPSPAFRLSGDSWYSPDGRFVAVATEKSFKRDSLPTRVWRIDGPEPVRVLDDLHDTYQEGTAFRPDSRQVAFGHHDGTVTIYDTETWHRIRDLTPGPNPIFTLVYHPFLPHLAVACGNELTIWDIDTGRRLLRLRHPGAVGAVAWHPRGHRLAVASGGSQIRLWDAESGRLLTDPWQGHKSDGIRLAFNHAGDRVVSNDWHLVVRLWDAATGQLLLSQPGDWGLRFSSDDQTLGISMGGEGNRLLRLAGGQEMRTYLRPTPRGPERISSTSLHPAGRLLAVVTPSGCGLWDLLTGEELDILPGAFNGEGCRFDSTGALWTFGQTGLLRWAVQPSADSPQRLRIGPPEWVANCPVNVDTPASHSADGRVAVVPLRNDGALLIHRGPPRRILRLGPQYDVRKVVLSPDGHWVVTGSHWPDGSGSRHKVWEVGTGRRIADLPDSQVSEIRNFSPDSRWLYYSDGKQDKRLEVASLLSAPVRSAVVAPASPRSWRENWRSELVPFGGSFSPDGSIRAVGGHEGTIRLLAPDAEKEIARLPSPESGYIAPTGFSPDGTLLLAIGQESGALYVFDLRGIREQLADLSLDWDAPAYPIRKNEEVRPALDAPLQVQCIGAKWAASRQAMAQYERHKAVAALLVNPFDADAHYRLGGLLLDAGRFAEAHAHLTAALVFRPDLETGYLLRAQAAYQLKRWDEAAADATSFLKKCPYDSSTLLLRARVNMERKHHDHSVADLTVLLAAYPQATSLYELRAQCYESLGQAEKAAADRDRALKLGANDPIRLNNQAWQLVTGPKGKRDPVQALALIQKAIEREPDNEIFLNTLGVVQYRNKHYPSAVVSLEKSLAAGKGRYDAFNLFFLAMCHAKLGDAAKAKDCYDRAVKWTAAKKDLSAHYADEIKVFRAEAETVLQGP